MNENFEYSHPLSKKTIKRNILNKRKIISTKVYHILNRKAIYMATLTSSVDTDEILHLLMDDKCSFKYSKTFVIRPLSKRRKISFQDQISPNAGQKYSRMLQGEHSAILLAFIKLPFVMKIIVFFLILRGHFTQVLL